ncbi:serine/threonine protein kinase, CMGC, CDC2/CDK sub [Neurospora sp. IMI 360204]|nr:serine/threonine protein kinase, CMGC, CDC2/CDK sub [Neurospora sp. IMI 360204]
MAETIHTLRDMQPPTHPSMARLPPNLLMVPGEGGTIRNFHHKVSMDIRMAITAPLPGRKHTTTRIKGIRRRILQPAQRPNTQQVRTVVGIGLHLVDSVVAHSVSLAEAIEAALKYTTTTENNSAHAQNSAAPSKHADSGQNTQEGAREDVNNSSRPAKDSQGDDTHKSGKEKEEQMQPPTRPAAGSQSQPSNKFSFSMKNATKPVVAAPRPEISLKFNAVVPPREPSQKQPPKAPAAAPPTAPSAHRSNRDRHDLPKNVPTEPASARARHNDRRGPDQHRPVDSHRPAEQQKPRTRIVKKIVKKLKEKPALPPDLAKSKSVYHRKPGNESVIGSGTYGKVFKALNVYTKKQVALKRIRMEGERDGFPVTAVREIKLLRSLSHKNIVKLMEVMVEMNECFMVFEYLSHDLTGLINHPNYTLDPAQKKHLALQLFEGLDYLHTRGVLHRDIKAANILVSNEGVLKLADFGLARFYAKHHQLDYTNRVITIWYRSPELLLGETQYGPAVDIWSAACVMMEIFTKRAIFPGDGSEINQLDKIHSVLGTPTRNDWPNIIEMPWFELLRPTQRRANVFAEKYKELVTPAAFELLLWMFKYDPDKRPSAAEVLAHPYFTTEEPAPRQAVELKDIDGEWHEFESKALRKENERKEREARRAVKEGAPTTTAAPSGGGGSSSARDKDRDPRKRPAETREAPPSERDSKPAAAGATTTARARTVISTHEAQGPTTKGTAATSAISIIFITITTANGTGAGTVKGTYKCPIRAGSKSKS